MLMKFRKTLVGMAVSVMVLATSGVALAGDVGDNQGWCKKQQGSSSCNGGSECSTRGQQEAPRGQAKKC